MKEKLLRVGLPILCLGLVQCTSNTTDTSSAPTAFATVRLNPTTGVADPGFGGTGIVKTDIDPTLFDFATTLAIQADNKILVGGSNGFAGAGQVALVRYVDADGSLDIGFGTAGIVKTLLALPADATAIAIQGDNKIVVAALAYEAVTSSSGNTSIVLLRYNPDGTLDTSFGNNHNGIAASAAIGSGLPGDRCALLLQSITGNLVVAGASQDGNLVLYRYTPAGVLDASFGTAGKTTTLLGVASSSPDRSPAMVAQSDGRIIVVSRNNDDQAVLRYSADGMPDTTFGGTTDGIVKTDIGGSVNFANAVAIQSSGAPGNLDKIVVVGHTNVSDNTSDISLVRYSKDGVPDASFGTNGIVTTDIGPGQFDNAFSVVFQDALGGAEPMILVTGSTGFSGATQMVVLRYNADGTADSTFGSRRIGQVFVPVVGPSTAALGNAIAIQPGLGIVVTGYD